MHKDLEIALKEVGTKEKDYTVKYFSDLFPGKKLEGWCVPFVEWVLKEAYGQQKALEMLYLDEFIQCPHELVKGFTERGKWHREHIHEGWLLFLRRQEHKRIDHVELIFSIINDDLVTIGGNCDGEVKQNAYKVGDSVIAGYGEINYEDSDI